MRAALETSVVGISAIETDTDENTCTFSAPADVDITAVLNEIAEETKQVKEWSFSE